MAPELGWSTERVEREVTSFLALAAGERQSAGLPAGLVDQ
jgi:hypothetical protein